MPKSRRLLRLALVVGLIGLALGLVTIGALYWLIAPRLPDVQVLRNTEMQVPLTVYSREGKLIAQFGETRRYPARIEDIPEQIKQAFIATEDARFYEHSGIDARGIARAVWLLATTSGRRVPGGSTITQQVARQFFLSSEYSYSRKLTEIFLALKMERELSKDEILELYLNKSFFGNRAYGIAAAAEFYYGKPLDRLSLAEAATLASIPKFPSSGNPISNPERALIRRNYVLARMLENGFIDKAQLEQAQREVQSAAPHEPPIEVEAPYLAEMVREAVVERYGPDALTSGLKVYTSIAASEQLAGNQAVYDALAAYDRRHGWRGAEAHWPLDAAPDHSALAKRLRDLGPVANLLPALVLQSDAGTASLLLGNGERVALNLKSVSWAAKYLSEHSRGPVPKRVDQVLAAGDVVRLIADGDSHSLAQIPKAQAALVALDPEDGGIRTLVGGFSFARSKFNRVTQSQRQPGSSFKPFVYASAFERGFTPASVVLDAPVVFRQQGLDADGEEKVWQPQNFNQNFSGPMRLREAMVTSRNLVSVRLLDAIGVNYARRFIQRFGFSAQSLPEDLSLALGTSSVPPLQLARGYAVFANGGFLIDPWFIERIENRDGVTLYQSHPATACRNCPQRMAQEKASGTQAGGFDLGGNTRQTTETVGPPSQMLAPRVVEERTVYLVGSLMRDVVRRGTGRGAMVLGRNDLAGKTGTTNDYRDAWFSGFGGGIVTTAWVGMDDFGSLGRGELGGPTALPAWIGFMRTALADRPEVIPPLPTGVVTAWVDRDTGLLAAPGSPDAIAEFFKLEDIARLEANTANAQPKTSDREAFDIF
ncbi:MAG: penicillin-binding protein 1A [Gammaproteobacteria bacterium HGW-Gammaproteobacteria-4]|jgi:penicillin-binding protein 1A|nr:MAG: penicillin-binding protein 1A [Gammaproteobacteria bacterium HGW-Gammaproteobacteria-4]